MVWVKNLTSSVRANITDPIPNCMASFVAIREEIFHPMSVLPHIAESQFEICILAVLFGHLLYRALLLRNVVHGGILPAKALPALSMLEP